MSGVFEFAKAARNASYIMAGLSASQKDAALSAVAQSLIAHKDTIEEENRKDIAQATLSGLAAPLLKRLLFDSNKIYAVVEGINSLISLPDPVGKTLLGTKMDD